MEAWLIEKIEAERKERERKEAERPRVEIPISPSKPPEKQKT